MPTCSLWVNNLNLQLYVIIIIIIIICLQHCRNIIQNYYKTGYIWEQYDQKTGKGKGVRQFTGWSSLVVLIMSESYSSNWGISNS